MPKRGQGNFAEYVRKLLASFGVGQTSGAAGVSNSGVRSDIPWRNLDRRRPERLVMEPEGLIERFERSWSGPPPCVALLGEFSAGKSSIINLLLGHEMLPTAVLSSTRRPTYVRHAAAVKVEAILADSTREAVSLDAVKTLEREDIDYFDIGMPAELLRHIVLLDTPGFADPYHDVERTLNVLGGVDICVWCTLATQAWRQSERLTWLNLPARFRTNGILVATHIDTLAHRGEHHRVQTRLKREAGDLFGDIVLLSVPAAARARSADGRIADLNLWRDSGGWAFVAALQRAVTDYGKTHRQRAGANEARPAPRAGGGSAPARQAVAATPPRPPAAVEAPAPAATAAAPGGGAAADLRAFLVQAMETVPACLAAAWIDLSQRRVLQLLGLGADDAVESASLGEAITELFQGSNVRKIEDLFKHSRGLALNDEHYFQEIVIVAEGYLGILLRAQSRADRSLVVISDSAVNLGMALARARGLLASTDRLM